MALGTGGRFRGGADPGFERRLPLLAAAIVLVFAVFAGRLFQLQILESDDLRMRSQSNSVRTVRLEAPRGDIVDREGRVLATTRPAFGLLVVPNELRRADHTFAALGLLLGREPLSLRARLGTPRGRDRFQPVSLEADLSWDLRTRVESHLYALPGVLTDVSPRRDYVSGRLASHLLGYIGEIQPRQLERRAYADYRPGEVIGQAGVEALLQEALRGRPGGRNQVVDVAGRVVEVLDEVQPVPGGQARLTLDLDLQRAAEAGFAPDPAELEAAEEEGREPREKMGALVALDPRNGDVLALVSKPDYDPNAFAGGIDAGTWRALTTDEWNPLQDRAISGQYPPGSTYKAIVAAGALHDEKMDPKEPVFCPGHFKLGRRTYRCWKAGGHGWVDLHRALVESCDVYFYRLGLELGIDRLAFFARGFGLGRSTDIPLSHEKPGLVPTQDWKERRFAEPWIRGETVSASIGQGFNLVTPLQLAVAFAAIANGGQVVKPRLVLEARDRDGQVRQAPEPAFAGKVPVDAVHLERVRQALVGVVHERRGTGGRSRVAGLTVAGKTGTAQVVRLEHTEDMEEDEIPIRYRDHAWFAAFAPAEDPQIAVSVLVEHGGHGGSAAAPIAQRVLQAWYDKHGAPEPGDEAESGRVAAAQGGE